MPVTAASYAHPLNFLVIVLCLAAQGIAEVMLNR